MNRVVLSSDNNRDYAFFAPIVSLLWRQRSYRPILFLVGTASDWVRKSDLSLALERSREVGAEVYFVGNETTDKIVRTSTIAQIVRIFGSLVPGIASDDYVLTSDMDMFPFGPWVGGGRDATKELQLWYANAYQQDYPRWPMCYIGATAKTWTEIIGGSDFKLQLVRALENTPSDESAAWNYDERLLGEMISRWGQKEKTQEINRTFVEGEWRIDRSDWDHTVSRIDNSLRGVADAHVLRPGYTGENWPKIRKVLSLALTQDQMMWIDEYRDLFTSRLIT